MPSLQPKFRVLMPRGKFNRRMVITSGDLKWIKEARKDTRPSRSTFSLGDIFLSEIVHGRDKFKTAQPLLTRIYEKVRKPVILDEPAPQSAAEHFLSFARDRRFNHKMLIDFPLLSAFIDELRTTEAAVDLRLVEDLALAGASELALCAGMVFCREESLSLEDDIRFKDVLFCGLRLGIELDRLEEGIDRIRGLLSRVRKAQGLNFAQLAKSQSYKTGKKRDWLYSAPLGGEQITCLVKLIRSVLKDADAKMLYSIIEMGGLEERARRRYEGGQSGLEQEDYYHMVNYMLEVLPVIEELKVTSLIEKAKDLFFMAFEPEKYRKIDRWFRRFFDVPTAIRHHIDNNIRLMREVGQITGLLPVDARITGRVKSIFSIHEKLHELPMLHDILALRVLVPSVEDVYRAAYLVKRTFSSVPFAIQRLEKLPQRYRDEDPSPLPHLKEIKKIMDNELKLKGYIDGVKDPFSGPRKGRVTYYSSVRVTHRDLPLEVQITTFKKEEENERLNPHWEYKLLKQLELYGLGEGIERGDFEPDPNGVYVMVLDEAQRSLEARFIPYGEEDPALGHPGSLQNGEILFIPAP